MATTDLSAKSGAATRQSILAAAFDLFSESGLHSTSLDAIARKAGVTRPLVIHHYRNKTALLLAVLEEQGRKGLSPWNPTSRDLPEHLDEIDLDSPEYAGVGLEDAIAIIESLVGLSQAQRPLVRLAHLCALESGPASATAVQWSRMRHARVRRLAAAAAEHSIKAGTVRRDIDPAEVGVFVVTAFEGLENQWLVDEAFDMQRGMHEMLALLWRDVRATDVGARPATA
ncbi:TetR/AcrR family transcriptional regulator [Microbacterium sp. MYb64]|uniref:TetR/AcrR family transcriptional regulator n=1 Tax=Microbacterium sp. MYb64 TaxID=1848691 RepID=UPI0015E30FF2|nr:TetR/AcrR family transcriptional regulator [Microbacterium sp. MYb64]